MTSSRTLDAAADRAVPAASVHVLTDFTVDAAVLLLWTGWLATLSTLVIAFHCSNACANVNVFSGLSVHNTQLLTYSQLFSIELVFLSLGMQLVSS